MVIKDAAIMRSSTMRNGALVVFTRKSKGALLNAGGTSAWALTPAVVRHFEYVVCARNSRVNSKDSENPGPEPHGSAFLVGKIASIDWLYYENERNRYRVNFSEVAEVNVENFWDGSRNPVRYYSLEEVRKRGLDFDKLDFVAIAGAGADRAPVLVPDDTDDRRSITFAEARCRFAEALGIAVDDLEITIRGKAISTSP
jgi:hypothetical protein